VQELIYLAVPYSHPDPAVRQQRFEAVNRAAADLMRDGVYVFSPISHTHSIALAGELPIDWNYWQGYDRTMLAACDRMVVLTLPGWEASVGVRAEMKIAQEMEMPIELRAPASQEVVLV
jgi:hypothetical protein